MAKYELAIDIVFAHLSGPYTPRTYSSGDTMQYRVAGYSMSIKWNQTEFKKWTEAQKRKAVFASRDLMRQWAAYIQEEARKKAVLTTVVI